MVTTVPKAKTYIDGYIRLYRIYAMKYRGKSVCMALILYTENDRHDRVQNGEKANLARRGGDEDPN